MAHYLDISIKMKAKQLLGQINIINISKYKLPTYQSFNPCINLKVNADILIFVASKTTSESQPVLRKALRTIIQIIKISAFKMAILQKHATIYITKEY